MGDQQEKGDLRSQGAAVQGSDDSATSASGDARTRRGAPQHVWVCRHCGKRSYAKKDPIAHERREHVWVAERRGVVRRYFWCGPFDRYVCELDTAKPQRDAATMPHLGTPSKSDECWDEDAGWTTDDEEVEVPF